MNSIVKIKENYEFRRAYKKGESLVSPYFVVYCFKNRRNNIRLGITVTKKIGGAVARNRAKRLITAAFRECLPEISCGYDFIIVARNRILTVKSTVVKEQMMKLFNSCGIAKSFENENIID